MMENKIGNIELRDWFAGCALEGILANHGIDMDGNPDNEFDTETSVKICYSLADAMLKVREEGIDFKVREEELLFCVIRGFKVVFGEGIKRDDILGMNKETGYIEKYEVEKHGTPFCESPFSSEEWEKLVQKYSKISEEDLSDD